MTFKGFGTEGDDYISPERARARADERHMAEEQARLECDCHKPIRSITVYLGKTQCRVCLRLIP